MTDDLSNAQQLFNEWLSSTIKSGKPAVVLDNHTDRHVRTLVANSFDILITKKGKLFMEAEPKVRELIDQYIAQSPKNLDGLTGRGAFSIGLTKFKSPQDVVLPEAHMKNSAYKIAAEQPEFMEILGRIQTGQTDPSCVTTQFPVLYEQETQALSEERKKEFDDWYSRFMQARMENIEGKDRERANIIRQHSGQRPILVIYGQGHSEIANALNANSLAVLKNQKAIYNGDLENHLPTHILVVDNNSNKPGNQSELLDLSDPETKKTFIQKQTGWRGSLKGVFMQKSMSDEEHAACLEKLPKANKTQNNGRSH